MGTDRYTLDELLTIDDAAMQLGIGYRTAQRRAHIRNLGRIFGTVRILTPADVDALAIAYTSEEGRQAAQARREAQNG